jgi:DNA-binding transcriptional ArsR family regulator
MSADAALRALAEPNRRAILRLVRDEPRSVNEITERLGISQQGVSQHLQVLRDAGLLAVRRDGRRRLYQVRPEGLDSVEAYLAELWPERLRQLKQSVEEDREG